jgi:hypothetical protein
VPAGDATVVAEINGSTTAPVHLPIGP